jgi:hypothetical protein
MRCKGTTIFLERRTKNKDFLSAVIVIDLHQGISATRRF